MSWYRFPIGAAVASLSLLACDPGNESCGVDEREVDGECVAIVDHAVHLNSVGFLPDRIKRATFKGGTGAFRVVVAESGEVVYEGQAVAAPNSADTGETGLQVADFSDVTQTGSFRVEAEGAGSSATFRIGADVMVEVARVLMKGMYGQRCGVAVNVEHQGFHFHHDACHLDDGLLDEFGKPNEKQPALYGWHDAGDYGKYVNNGSLSLANMLFAWDQFPALRELRFGVEDPRGLPEFLDECRFQLDWLLGMQMEDGGVSDRVTTRKFDGMVSPEQSTDPRFMAPVTTTATADFVAVLAHAARSFAEYDEALSNQYREAALASWEFLKANPAPIGVDPTFRQRFTGGYISGDADDRLWAAAEIWALTGDAEALEAFEARAAMLVVDQTFDWPNLNNLATFAYLLSDREGKNPEIVAALTSALATGNEQLRNMALSHPYGRATGYQYYWGINGVLARAAMNFGVLDALVPDPRNKDAIAMMLDHLLGRNYYGRSFVTGIGDNPAFYPHHRPSVADSTIAPWPGLLVGGSWGEGAAAPATLWVDAATDYNTNEVAINWNASMIYAAAALLP